MKLDDFKNQLQALANQAAANGFSMVAFIVDPVPEQVEGGVMQNYVNAIRLPHPQTRPGVPPHSMQWECMISILTAWVNESSKTYESMKLNALLVGVNLDAPINTDEPDDYHLTT